MSQIFQNRRGVAIGDIHGCDRALESLVEQMDLTAEDFVVVLGDAIDRGPDSCRVLDTLLEVRVTCELIFILGNHEEMLLNAMKGRNRDEWLQHGGIETLESYGGEFDDIPDQHLELLETAARYWEGPTEICVHASLEPGVPLERQRSSWLRWVKLSGRELPHPSGKRIICGHSGIGYAVPTSRNGWICLDTKACSGGILSALDLKSGEILQARQNGQARRGVFLHELET